MKFPLVLEFFEFDVLKSYFRIWYLFR